MSAITGGTYNIVNVAHNRVAYLSGNSCGTPITGMIPVTDYNAQWTVSPTNSSSTHGKSASGFTIVNVGQKNDADAKIRSVGATVVGDNSQSLVSPAFDIKPTSVPGFYTITSVNTPLCWFLENKDSGTAVTLTDMGNNDQRAWWIFQPVQSNKGPLHKGH